MSACETDAERMAAMARGDVVIVTELGPYDLGHAPELRVYGAGERTYRCRGVDELRSAITACLADAEVRDVE